MVKCIYAVGRAARAPVPYLSSEMRQVNGVGVLLEFGDDQGSMADVLLRRPKNGKRESQTKGTVKKSIQG